MPAFQQITDDGFPGAKSLDFIGQRIVYVEPFGRFWGWSDLADGSSWNSLETAQAETSPDRIQGLIASHNEVLIFGERTIEPWAHAPTETAVFQLQAGSVIESGCASGKTLQRLDNSVFYLTNNGQVAKLNGYTPQVISTVAMEAAIRDCNWSRAFSFVYEDSGHAIYYITFPDGHTWGYDVRQGKWHRRESYGLDRWRINALCKSNGKWYAGDFQSGRIYEVQWGNTYEGCEIMPRKWRSGVLHNEFNRLHMHGFRVGVSTGQPPKMPATAEPTVTTQYEVLITGAYKTTSTNPMWCVGYAVEVPTFTGIEQATGADITAAAGTYQPDVGWSVVDNNEARYAPTLSGSWATGSVTAGILRYHSSGPGGALVAHTSAGNMLYDRYSEAGTYTSFEPSASYSNGDNFPTINSDNLDYLWSTTNYWWAGYDRALLRADSVEGPYVAVRDGFKNTAEGLDNNGAVVIGFPCGVEFGNKLYLGAAFHFDAGQRRYQIRTSTDDGETIPDDQILYNVASTTDNSRPCQAVATTSAAVFLFHNLKVGTSANNFASLIPTGLSGSISESAKGRHIVAVGSLLFVAVGDQCVVSADGGLTWGDPITLPIATVVSISTNYIPSTVVEVPPCDPMESGAIQMRYSNDGSENWSNWRDFAEPQTGQFLQNLTMRRLGMARQRTWEYMDTSNRPQDVMAASIHAEAE